MNKPLGESLFFFLILQGASPDWWNNMHFQHHSKPNIIDKDPDTRIEPLFLLGDTIPIRVGLYFSLGNRTMILSSIESSNQCKIRKENAV